MSVNVLLRWNDETSREDIAERAAPAANSFAETIVSMAQAEGASA
jgi:hypothetical protein